MNQFNLHALAPYAPLFLRGIAVSLIATAIPTLVSFPLGLAFAVVRVGHSLRFIRIGLGIYVELVRNLPLLIVLYIIYFGLPAVGIRWDGITSGIVALTLSSTAFSSEIFRGGLA